MAKKKTSSKSKKTFIAILTIVLVIVLITAIVYISVKGMWKDMFDYIRLMINRENNTENEPELVPDGTLEVKVLDIGQGDCILITFPDNKIMVMDAGSEFGTTSPWNTLDGELKAKGITTIDYMFLTHTDYDHSGEVAKLAENYDIKSFYFPKADLDTSNTWKNAYNAAKEETYVESGETKQAEYHENIGQFRIETTSWRMKCYSFDEEDYPSIKNSSSAEKKNSVSPVCLLEYADRTIVLTGDANFDTEEYLLAKGYLDGVDADVLKVGHHGSKSSTSDEFLDVIDCEYAIISASDDNDYGHPTPEALQRLEDYTDIKPDDDFNGFAEVYRTDQDGTITIRVDEKGVLQINSEKTPDKNATVGGVFQEQEINQSGEVVMAYFKQDYFEYMAA